MNSIEALIKEEELIIYPDHEALQYCGRIDFDNRKAPIFVYSCSSIVMRFTGTTLKIVIENNRGCWDNYLGFIIDGKQEKVLIDKAINKKMICITLVEGLEDKEHSLLFFKRMDSCHIFTFLGFVLDKGARIIKAEELPMRKIEVYGDSVSAGEVSEAVEFIGKTDPVHNGEYSNSWYSYAWMTARKLNAQIHNIAQGGIALLNNTGWFASPNYVGLEQTFDKLEYNPDLGIIKPWDFRKYRPHVIVVAIGQNDNHPEDYMKEDYNSEKALFWRKKYKALVEAIREKNKSSLIILATTILYHDSNWDKAIDEVCNELEDDLVVHFLYKRNGCGTPGHIRISEADEMSDELAAFIDTYGETIWENEVVNE